MRKFPSKLAKAKKAMRKKTIAKRATNNKKTIDEDTNLLNLQGFQQFLPNILRYLDNKSLLEFHLTCKKLRCRIRGDPIWRNRIVTRINIFENRALQAFMNLGVSPNILEDLKLEEKSVAELEKFVPVRRQVLLQTLYRLEHFFDDDKDVGEDDEGEDEEADDGEDDDGEDDDEEDEEAEDDNEDDQDNQAILISI